MNSRIKIIILLLTCCLAGIITFQLLWFNMSYREKSKQFDRQVNEMLRRVADKTQSYEVLSLLGADSGDTMVIRNTCKNIDTTGFFNKPVPGARQVFISKPDKKFKTIVISNDIKLDTDSSGKKFKSTICCNQNNNDSIRAFIQFSDMAHCADTSLKKIKLKSRSKLIRSVVDKIVTEITLSDVPSLRRFSNGSIDSLLKAEAKFNGVDTLFEYAIYPEGGTSPLAVRSPGYKNDMRDKSYRIGLNPDFLFSEPDYMVVFFPGKNNFLLRSMWVLMMVSLLFTLGIIATFYTTIRIIIRQKKIAEIKTDFINNMTHEFKTPIATISLAADAVSNPKVTGDPLQVRQFMQIIKEENNRMNQRVEQVLQMAMLDRNEFIPDKTDVDIHELIDHAVQKIKLQVETREGSVVVSCQAEKHQVKGDPLHLLNALINLLDNANKYSPEKPEIFIETLQEGSSLYIRIRDKGIGMTREQQKKIFDSFYRVSTGNIHDIKGFGLGLSYAKAIIQAHNGQVSVKSEPGAGSCFEIMLPLSL
jgi:two-component system, OmpR family, phosphate regulon sensor histidine kinase PhoR